MGAIPKAEFDRLAAACAQAGIELGEPELLSLGDSATVAVNGEVIAKVTRFPGQRDVAHREVAVSRWLGRAGIPAVVAVTDAIDQGAYAVTFWERITEHRSATPGEVGAILSQLHAVPVESAPELDDVQPFVRVADRIDGAPLRHGDKAFLLERLGELEERWPAPTGLGAAILHGDPNTGNVVVTPDGQVLVWDLERFSVGPREWDLTLQAVSYETCRWITADDYGDFVTTYGHDVTATGTFPIFRDIRELRMTSWLANKADQDPAIQTEVEYRIACLRGQHGPRPWSWTAG
ncbi:aminoglycoside phosphotransferase family protein [Kribbella catacumbae]|uniref:aminoglycoside phosphotransferase family protein n=1 Tax=Kribbella catacumbae TaxID=460086 RepID=UPI0003703251|nr:aminoglycoside phosphotransferase family protein [Kribbella catacumbae]